MHSSNLESNRCICAYLQLIFQRPWNLHQIKRILSAKNSPTSTMNTGSQQDSVSVLKYFKGMWLFSLSLHFLHYELICLVFTGQPVLTKVMNVGIFCSLITDIQLFTLKNNPLVPYWKPHVRWWCMKDWATLCPLILVIYEHISNNIQYIWEGILENTDINGRRRYWHFT